MFANQGRRPGRSPAAHGIWKRAAAAFAAVILLAVTLFSDIPTVHSDSGTWEKEPYKACYLMFDTDPTNNENVHDGLMFEGHRDFTKGVMESYSNWEAKTGVDLTSRELWAPVYEWLQIVSGNQPVHLSLRFAAERTSEAASVIIFCHSTVSWIKSFAPEKCFKSSGSNARILAQYGGTPRVLPHIADSAFCNHLINNTV